MVSNSNNMKKVSVILTTYNGGNTLELVISSILNQASINQEFELELIVIDDCSTDNTVGVVGKFDIPLYTTTSTSGGPNKGRNIGLQKATGDYICIADQDDIWEKHKIISLLPYLEKVPIVTSGYTVIDRSTNKNIIRVNKNDKGHVYYAKNKTFLSRLTKSETGQHTYLGSIIYSKELKDILFEETFGMVDFDWVLRLFHRRDSIEVCKSLYIRYLDGQNLSLSNSFSTKDFYYSLMFIENYLDEYPESVRKGNLRLHGSRARYLYLNNNMRMARFYFLRSRWGLKTALYYLTSFTGSTLIKKKFNVFG